MPTTTLSVLELTNNRSLLLWVALECLVILVWLFFQFRIATKWYAIARLVRLSVIPYVALLLGQISPRDMGLTGYDWSNSLSLGSLVMVAMLALWIGMRTVSATVSSDLLEQPLLESNRFATWPNRGLLVLLSGGLELNWSFWRASGAQIFNSLFMPIQSPTYWGIALAFVIVLPDTLRATTSHVGRILNVAILIATSVLFLFTKNLWLCWILHFLLQWTIPPLTEQS